MKFVNNASKRGKINITSLDYLKFSPRSLSPVAAFSQPFSSNEIPFVEAPHFHLIPLIPHFFVEIVSVWDPHIAT